MDSTEFIWGTFDTSFLSKRNLQQLDRNTDGGERVAAVSAALLAHEQRRHAAVLVGAESGSVESQPSAWKLNARRNAVNGGR